MTWRIPFADIRLGPEEKAAVAAVLDSNWLTMGPKTEAFERAFAEAMRVPGLQAVAVTNCTAALHLALAAVGVGPGDEVIVPALTFAATANAARYLGASPVFADIVSENDWTLDPADVARKITARTKAIVPVHYGGYPCRMHELTQLAEQHGLKVVEDASHAPLSFWDGTAIGAMSEVGCFSFFGNKNMTTGEGGMIVAREEKHLDACRLMRSHGMSSNTYARWRGHAFGYDVVGLGWNYRIDEMRAALGLVQLTKVSAFNRIRRELTRYYRLKLAEMAPSVRVPFRDIDGELAFHIFPVLLPEGGPARESVMQALRESGIQTSIHYRPLHWMTDFADGSKIALPVTDRIAPYILSLPLSPSLTQAQIDEVVESLAACL